MRIRRTLHHFLGQSSDQERNFYIHGSFLNEEIPKMTSFTHKGDEDFWENASAPDLLFLRCRIEPVFTKERPQAQYIHLGKSLIPKKIFSEDRPPIEGVNIHFEGEGEFLKRGGGTEPFSGKRFGEYRLKIKHPVFYKRKFSVAPNLKISSSILEKKVMISPPGEIDVQAYFPYGGSFFEGILLGEIQQYFCAVSCSSTHTLLATHSAESLIKGGANLYKKEPQKVKNLGKISFQKPLEEGKTFSLYEDIINGKISIDLSSPASKKSVFYDSIEAKQLGHSPFFTLTLKRRKS